MVFFLTLDAGVHLGRTVAVGPAADTGDYPVTGDVSDRLRWLPFHNGLTDAGMEQTTGAVLGIQLRGRGRMRAARLKRARCR